MKKITGYGVDIEKEIREQSETDWFLGASTLKGLSDDIGGVVTALHAWSRRIIDGVYQMSTGAFNHCIISYREKYAKYYPEGELQNLGEDKMDCVARGFNNEAEYELNYLLENDKISPVSLAWFKERGFIVNGKFLLSNRIPAMLSGTTRTGNSLKALAVCMENNGIFPRLLEEGVPMTWAQYHDKSKITQEMKDIGLKSKEYIKINYVKVYASAFAKFFGWFKWKIFDNYKDVVDGDFIKVLAENYRFIGYGYKLIINDLKKNYIIEEGENMTLKRIDGEKKVWACIGSKKYWVVRWENLEDFLELFGFKTLQEAQKEVQLVADKHLDNYINAGVIGDPSIMDILFGGITK